MHSSIVNSYEVIGNVNAQTVLIFFHGWMSCSKDIKNSLNWRKIARLYELLIVLPTAVQNQWFTYENINEKKVRHLATVSEIKSLKNIRTSLLNFIKLFWNEDKKLLLGGYSQGGSVALDIGLTLSIVDAIWISSSAPYSNMLREYDLNKKIYIHHGDLDTVFDNERVINTFKKFTQVKMKVSNTNHWEFMKTTEMEHFLNFLNSSMNR